MENNLEYNMKALLSYANTKRFKDIWESKKSYDLLAQRTNIFLEFFNTFKDGLVNQTEQEYDNLIKLISKREFFKILIDEGLEKTIQSLNTYMKLKEEIKESSNLPEFNVNYDDYMNFYNKALEYYKESDRFHKLRQELGIQNAMYGFNSHWDLVGEMFNQTIAKNYVKNINSGKEIKVPEPFLETLSGKDYLLKINPSETNFFKKTTRF